MILEKDVKFVRSIKLRKKLLNLPERYRLDLKNYCLETNCDSCNKKIFLEIKSRNIRPDGFHYCVKCANTLNSKKCSKEQKIKSLTKAMETLKNNPEIRRSNMIKYNRSDLGRQKSKENGNKYGKQNLNIIPTFNDNGEYYDLKLKTFIPWEEYKNKFKIQNVNFKLPEGFKLFSTFRTQDSEDWSGARQAFEQNLIDENISWFTYIKFYITPDSNKIRPLVIGKSGSKLVNANGSDVNFSTNINDGPARRYLQEEGLYWCKTQIAVKRCETEQEALQIEKEIQENYNLFKS